MVIANEPSSTKECLIFEEIPSSPANVRKFRRSAYLEPGKRYQHPGLTDDYPKLHLEDKIFGITDKSSRDGAADLLHQPKMTELQRISNLKAEKVYKHTLREPLGRIPDRKFQLPSKFTEGIVAIMFYLHFVFMSVHIVQRS
jgi:hypothetical protein